MEEVKIFVELPQEVERWLIQNETSLARLLRQQGVEVRESYDVNPFWEEGDAVGLGLDLTFAVNCMAVSALAIAVSVSVGNILSIQNKKPVQATLRYERVVRDAQNNVAFGNDGKEIREIEEIPLLLEPNPENSKLGLEFKAGDKILFNFGSFRKEIK
ncbi:MAG: hypothetical protein D3909_16770 [Candidatus Electrothrix sp. ATG1]|nr:hypothetical protein [Candidatus Electrothrix sp. ATG1]